jgi:L-threonylcarbamoyladenylate synthase
VTGKVNCENDASNKAAMDTPNTAKRHSVDPRFPDREVMKQAGVLLREGALVIFPTETVYGIGANSRDADAVERVYALKKRSRDKPLTYHFADLDAFLEFAGKGLDEQRLMWFKKWMPNPVTLVYEDTRTGRSIGVRIPDCPACRGILGEAGCPVVATSVNVSGQAAVIEPAEIRPELLSGVDAVVDQGPTALGRESTVIDIRGPEPRILRQGAFQP